MVAFLATLVIVCQDAERGRLESMNHNDSIYCSRLIKHDIRINAGPKHILEALNPAAYEAFHASLDLSEVVRKSLAEGELAISV